MSGAPSWARVKDVLQSALEQPAEVRAEFVMRACGSDRLLSEEVESLLTAHAHAGSFAERPALHVLIDLDAASDANSRTKARLLAPGDRVGPYEVVHFIGAGGMGEVYKAIDTRLHRAVALKVLPRRGHGLELLQQFEREATTVAAVRHPHICVLFDVGTHGGIDYLVMEHLEGETLAERIARGPLPPEDVLRSAREIADALAEMHRRGVVHRDIKPSNIMLTAGGAKLLDFGVAKLRSEPLLVAEGAAQMDSGGTRSSALGTLEYMAPEQLQGRDVDSRTDLFALGAVLYEMLIGVKAFRGESALAVSVQILESDPPPFETDASPLLPPLDVIIRRCLEKDPARRWQSAGELAAALPAFSAAPRRGTPTSVRNYALLALGALAVAAVLATTLPRDGPSTEATGPHESRLTEALVVGNMRLLTVEERLETDPRISPDDTLIAYSAGNLRRRRIFTRPLQGGRATAVGDDSDEPQFQPRWSPDGRELLYVTPAGAFVVPISGGAAKHIEMPSPIVRRESTSALTLESGFAVHSAAWSPGGDEVAITSGGSLVVVSLKGGERRTLVDDGGAILHSCDWSRDGKWIACIAGNWSGSLFANISPSAIVAAPAKGGTLLEVANARALHLSPVWSAKDGRLYFISNRQGANDVYSVEISAAGVVSEPIRVTTGLGANAIALSNDGRQLVYASASVRANLWSLPVPNQGAVTAANAEPVTTGLQTVEAMRVSPDGKWLLYDSNQQGNADIFRLPIGGGAPERLTTDPADQFGPDLSPDGRWIAFHSWRTTSRDIFVQPVDGGPAEQVTNSPAQEIYPVWSPDGGSLAFYDGTVERGVFRGAFLVHRRPSGSWSSPEPLRGATGSCRPPVPCRMSWAPNGRFVVSAHGGAVTIISVDTGAPRTVYTPQRPDDPRAEYVVVADDGALLYFKSHDAEGRAALWSLPVSAGPPVLRVRFDDLLRPSMRPEFAVGNGRFFFTIEDRRSNIWVADAKSP